MFHRRESNWIGFQQAQKTLSSLKEEVEIVEKKLYNTKRSFNEQTANAKKKSYQDEFSTEKHLKKTQLPKSSNLYFLKEKIVPYKASLLDDERETVPKKIFSASEEEPDIPPSKFPHTGPLDFKNTLISSFNNLLSTTEDSISVENVKHSSSEGTSSLIASTYREADKLPKKNETKVKVIETDSSKSFTTETSRQGNDYKKKKVFSTKESLPISAGDVGMEWTDVSKNRAFSLQNKFKTESIHKLKEIIDRQKKKQELYQLRLEKDVLSNFESQYQEDIHYNLTHQPVLAVKNDQDIFIPVRKVCTVKSFPNYKGFSAPVTNLSTNKRWRKQRHKHTIANSPNLKTYGANLPKRKVALKSESNDVSHFRAREVNKSTKTTSKDESFCQEASNTYSKTVKESSQDKVPDSKPNIEPLERSNDLKIDTESVLNNNQLSNDDSLQDVKDTTFSYDISIQAVSSMKDNEKNILKENEKAVKSKGSKKKSKVLQEQNVSSPKIRQYDVEKVREYIKKKKEERRKRHLEEHKKKMLENQKKKECLEKLIEHQKQNMKMVAKVKPLSPVKISHKDNLITTEHENVHENIVLRNKHLGKTSTLQDVNALQEKDVIPSDEDSKKKLLQESPQKDDSAKNQASISKSQKRKTDNVHMDISISKVISLSVHQTVTKNVKDTENLPSGTSFKPVKAATQLEPVTKLPIDSSVQDTVIKAVNYQDSEGISMDIDDSHLFTNISSVSTPSGISQITGVDSKLIEEIKVCEDPFPNTKQRKDKELKKMIENINEMTEPLEPLLYTKQWVSENPFPPITLKPRISEKINSSKLQHFPKSVKNRDIQLDISQSQDSKESSFKEQVSNIGDISQLYAQILNKKSTNEVVPGFERQSAIKKSRPDYQETHQHHIRNSEAQQHSTASDYSSHFSDLQKENIIPDPFNFINTWRKKPLGFTVHSRMLKSKGVDAPTKQSNSNIPYEELYKSMINTSSEQTKPSDSCTPETSQDIFSQERETSSDIQEKSSVSRTETPNEISSNVSVATAGSSKTSSSKSVISSKKLSKKSTSKKHVSSKSESPVNEININKISDLSSDKQVASFSTTTKKKHLSEQSIEKIPDVHSSNLSEMILSGTINSEYTLEDAKSPSANISGIHSSNASDVILSGTILSEYTLDKDDEDDESVKEEIEEFAKECSNEKASASESSVSEVVSVVENSKGFRSSAEDLLSNRSMSSNDLECSVHNSTNNKSISSDKNSSGHLLKDEAVLQPDLSHAQDQNSISVHSSKVLKNEVELTTLSQNNNHFQSIPSASQNSVTIDFRQPLQLTLLNGKSVQSNQELNNIHENQYLQAQVVTRVASEAAAAAATSAVIAVFETQKALLAEKNPFGIMNAYGRSSSGKKTHYSSDFESTADAKSSLSSPDSNTVTNKNAASIAEDMPASSNNEISPSHESLEEQILSNHSNVAPSKSSDSSSIKTERSKPSVYSEAIENEGQKITARNKRKISSNISSPSPASLSENESITTETSMSSHSNLSHLSESALSDDFFAQLTLDVVHKMTQEEELRAMHQLASLKFDEKVLVQKARVEMALLESLKKKLRQKGAEKKVSTIKRKQKELILRLRQERIQLQCLQEAYRSRCEKHNFISKDKKKLLSEPSLLAFELLNKDEKPGTSNYSEQKLKEFYVQKSSSTSTLSSNNDEKNVIGEDSMSEVPEMLKGLGSNSSQESVIESQPSEFAKTSGSSQNKSQRSSPNPPFSHLNAAPSNSNASIHTNNSLESMLQGLKKLESSKRHLTKREQRIIQRRKKVEHLLHWQKKLDNEEMAVRELEKKALDIVDHSRKKTKYYVSSSGSTNQEDDKRRELNYESLPPSSETPSQLSKQSEKLPVQFVSKSENEIFKPTSDESIPTDFSANGLEVSNDDDKGDVQDSSMTHSTGSPPEDIRAGSGGSSVQTIEITENGSQAEEVASEEIANQVSPSIKDKSSSSDVYSESFESAVSRKSPSVLSISPPFKSSSPSKSIKKDCGPGIRLPLVPRNLRRHDSSGSDDSYTISQSETASDQSDIEVRIHALSEELKRRKAEAEKIKREQKKKNRERLKEKELSLQKQLEAYNHYIQQAKLELDLQIESAVSPCQTSDVVVKPRIKWPRPEKVVDSHRVRKQPSLSSDTFNVEKKPEIINSSPEISESYGATVSKENDEGMKKLFPELPSKIHEENINKDISEKSTDDSKEVSSEALSVDNSSKAQEISETMPTHSVSSEIPSEKLFLEISENISLSSPRSQDLSEVKSTDSDQKHNAIVSSSCENKSSVNRSNSKSETDTFTSESTSSRSSDLNSLQVDDSIVSNKTVSSNSESKNTAKSSKYLIQKVNVQQSPNASHDVSSSEDSVSEIPSVANSISLDEKLDCENLSKNSKCDSSEGCESSSIKKVTDGGNEHENLLDITSPSLTEVKKDQKRFASESKIVNLVNYLSTSLFSDAFHNLFEILNERGTLKNILNHKYHENKLQEDSHCVKDKVVEVLLQSLLDHHLKDAFTSLFSILENRRTKSQKSVSLSSNVFNAKSNIHATASLTFPYTLGIDPTTIIEETSEFPFNQLSHNTNSNQIFAEPANLNYLTTSENEQQFQQQQLILQQYSYFYRKIPNKPPPPYTPPSSAALSSEFPFVKEKKVEKVTTVKKVTKHIDEVVDHALDVILDGKLKGLPLSDISLSTEKFNLDKLELSTPPQSVFVEFVFDLTKEIILEKFSETEQVPQPWLRPRKLTPKPVIPTSKEVLLMSIKKELEKALRINEEPKNHNRRMQFSWSALKLGRKKRDFVDTILISELKEEEPDWVNYDQDEVTVKLQIADSILNVLINDTVCTIKNLQQKLQL